MKVMVNGAWRELTAAHLAEALAQLGYGERIVGTAVNDEFVAVSERAARPLREGDRIEVLAPMQGG